MANPKLVEILRKLDQSGLIRHVNGNTLDNRVENLQWVSAQDAFNNKNWTVDAVCHLTDQEFAIWQSERN